MAQQWTCRICLNNIEPRINSQSIFTLTRTGQMISEVLSNLSSVQIHKNDGFPDVFCGNCEEKITIAVDLCLLIRASDCQLRKREWYIDFEPQSSNVTTEANNEQNVESYNQMSQYTEETVPRESNNLESYNQMSQYQYPNRDLATGETVPRGSNSPISSNEIVTNKTDLVANTSASYECGICFKTYERESDLDTHKNTHKQWMCNICGICVEKKALLDNHKCLSISEKHFVCKQCNKEFASRYALIQHSTSHKNKIRCHICGKFIASGFILQNHLENHARNPNFNHKRKKEFPCNNCGKVFKSAKEIDDHLKSYGMNGPFCCNLCGKKFVKICKYSTHMQVHGGETSFVCGFCKNEFPCLSSLQRHIRKCHPQSI